MTASWLGSDTSVYYADLVDAITGAQEEEQGRYQAGLQPYEEAAQYYEPGGEYAQQQPSYLYSSFIQPYVGGSGGALRNLFSTTKAGQISMKAAQEAELQRGQMYSSAQQALGEATQRYPMMPTFGTIPDAIASEYKANEQQIESSGGGYSNPTSPPSSAGENGGGAGTEAAGSDSGTSGGGGGGSTSGGGGSSQGESALWMDISGNLYWGNYGQGSLDMMTYVGGWDQLSQFSGSSAPITYVDPNTGQTQNIAMSDFVNLAEQWLDEGA